MAVIVFLESEVDGACGLYNGDLLQLQCDQEWLRADTCKLIMHGLKYGNPNELQSGVWLLNCMVCILMVSTGVLATIIQQKSHSVVYLHMYSVFVSASVTGCNCSAFAPSVHLAVL